MASVSMPDTGKGGKVPPKMFRGMAGLCLAAVMTVVGNAGRDIWAPDPAVSWATNFHQLVEDRGRVHSSRERQRAARTTICSSRLQGMSSQSSDPDMSVSDPAAVMEQNVGAGRRGAW